MRQIILFIIFILSSVTVLSESKFLEGYIITPKNDTIKGFIDYKNWKINPKKINFKLSVDASEVKCLTISDISSFGVNKEVYISAEIEREESSILTDNLENNSKLNIVSDSVFLQALILGKKNLFYFYTDTDKKLFYIQNGKDYELLKYKKYISQTQQSSTIKENKIYIGQLRYYLNNDEHINFDNITYDLTSLSKAFMSYYKAQKVEIKYQKTKDKFILEYGLIFGLCRTNVGFNSNIGYLNNSNFKSSNDFSGGLSISVIIPGTHKKCILYNELLYNQYDVIGHYREFTNENQYLIYNSELAYKYLKLNNMFRYKFHMGKFQLFINAGFSNGFAVYKRNFLNQLSHFYSTESSVDSHLLSESGKYEQSFLFGAGISSGRLSFELRSELSNGMSPYVETDSSVKRYNFLVGYRF